MCVRVCVRVCVHACIYACVCVCESIYWELKDKACMVLDSTVSKPQRTLEPIPLQVEAMLQRSYDDFVAVTEKVLEAQKGVTQAIKDHHHKLTEATTAIPADEKMESVAGT